MNPSPEAAAVVVSPDGKTFRFWKDRIDEVPDGFVSFTEGVPYFKQNGSLKEEFWSLPRLILQDDAEFIERLNAKYKASQRNHQHLLTVLQPFQLEKLERDVSKGDWKESSLDELSFDLVGEFIELRAEIKRGTPESIVSECADVANFAAMIADKVLSEVGAE
jgi:hypothetical protein